jgi:hypothetical protein
MVRPLWQKRGKRKPTEVDINLWLRAADKRNSPRSKREIIEYLKAKNPHRWRRLQSDIHWMQKMMGKLGYSPDDWKELL